MVSINHLHVFLRAECHLSPQAEDVEQVRKNVLKLVKDVNMQVFMEPRVKYMPDIGNEGLTWVVGLETSHSSFHAWDKPDNNLMKYKDSTLLQMDMYTCGPLCESEIKVLLQFIEEYQPKLLSLNMYDRSKHDSMESPIVKIRYDEACGSSYKDFVDSLKIVYNEEK